MFPSCEITVNPPSGYVLLDLGPLTLTLLPPTDADAVAFAGECHQQGGGPASRWLAEAEGCRFWAWLLARTCHPTLRPNDLAGLITAENVPDVLASLGDCLPVAVKAERYVEGVAGYIDRVLYVCTNPAGTPFGESPMQQSQAEPVPARVDPVTPEAAHATPRVYPSLASLYTRLAAWVREQYLWAAGLPD